MRSTMIDFEKTELRLGLPGAGGGENEGETSRNSSGKRGFSETVDLKLNLNSNSSDGNQVEDMKQKNIIPASSDSAKPPTKLVPVYLSFFFGFFQSNVIILYGILS
ncbi:auxin-responsive IAA16 [Olea europaea subsp. europaea]|uniref:Auxin-responsive IAA16 n=1 Tax=Olea europaea subsp. europaea TaxID=158383 RepID=A0A8S0SD57_OLEEU|nr:auxin-responsive IAA16 [Olea europaea subsp. europaea]